MADADMPLILTDFDPRAGTRMAADVLYAHAVLGGVPVALHGTLYLPAPGGAAAPLLVWLPGNGHPTEQHDGQHDGQRGRLQTRRLARQLTAAGFALATPQLRPRAECDDLAEATRARLAEIERMPVAPGAARLTGWPALAATEDAARFVGWLAARAAALGLAPRPVLGGTGDGAATAFNLAFLAPFLGLERPEPAGILSFSGGFAWPGLYRPAVYPVFALHNPFDQTLDIGPIRALSQIDPALELIEAWEHQHGALRVHPKESRTQAYGRLRALLRDWCGVAAA